MGRMTSAKRAAYSIVIIGALLLVLVASPLLLAQSGLAAPTKMALEPVHRGLARHPVRANDHAGADSVVATAAQVSQSPSLRQARLQYEQAAECAKYTRLQRGMAADSQKGGSTERQFDQLESRDLDIFEQNVRFLESHAARCQGGKEDDIYYAALSAALAGDEDAAACFVASPWSINKVPESREVIALYERYALPLAEAAIARGDWTMVRLLADAYGLMGSDGLVALIGRADPSMQLRYLKLLDMGATPAMRAQLAPMIPQATRPLSAKEEATATTWAANTFASHFRFAGAYDGSVADCTF